MAAAQGIQFADSWFHRIMFGSLPNNDSHADGKEAAASRMASVTPPRYGDRRIVHISLCHLPQGSFECLSFRGGQKLHDGQPKQLREPGGGETDEAAGVTNSGGRGKTRCHDPAPAANAPPGEF